jgi:hypothetical protein
LSQWKAQVKIGESASLENAFDVLDRAVAVEETDVSSTQLTLVTSLNKWVLVVMEKGSLRQQR